MNIEVWTDGALQETNPGPGSWAFYAEDGDGNMIGNGAGLLGTCVTNNEAEYAGLYFAMKWLIQYVTEGDVVTIHMDSQLVVNQVNCRWRVGAASLRGWAGTCSVDLLNLGIQLGRGNVELVWVPREQNTKADSLSRLPIGW